MKRVRIILLAVLVFGLGYGATSVVAQVGAALYKNPATGRSFPQQISAGYLATRDGGVVNVMNSPAPTAVGQAIRSITTGTNASAGFVNDPDGGVFSAGGTTNYIPEWTGPHTLGNSTLRESNNVLYGARTVSNYFRLDTYRAGTAYASVLELRHSFNDALLGMGTTPDYSQLGQLRFWGVGGSSTWQLGALITAEQSGTAGTYVPTKLCLYTYSASGSNSTQECLKPDNSVAFSGAISAASYPTIGIAFKSTDSSIGITTNTNTTSNVNLQVGANVPRYAGSGTADPSQSPGVAAPILSFYYQTVHAVDGGASYGLWWKSGTGDTQWTELAQGSGSSSVVAISSPDNSIAVGAGGGTTTVEVNYGHTSHTAIQGSDWNAAGGVCPLDGSALVPVANLPEDIYTVRAAGGTTPGYLADVCESTDSSITIGQTGNYVTFDANFGTGASQVCSGATCAGKQATLPGGTNGQALVASVTGTGTTTNYQPATLPVYTSMSLATQARIGAARRVCKSRRTKL